MHTEEIKLRQDATTPSDNAVDRPPLSGWWEPYKAQLAFKGLSPSAIAALDHDSDYVATSGIFGAGGRDGSFAGWPTTRLRKGLVMGAVQSGKTASLVAVVTKALDAGVDIVVVLAGTRIALWHQTYLRILNQLDQWSEETDSARRSQRVLLPPPLLAATSTGSIDLQTLYFETPNMVRRMLNKRRPVIAVVMKQTDHLERVGRFLKPIIESTIALGNRPLHMLVIDDEADDGSILDSEAEYGLEVDSQGLKQIPRRITRLWSDEDPGVQTFAEGLFTSYVAYTATPQANLLQSDHNPLSPTDFIASLRVPYDRGDLLKPRTATYLESRGISAYYTGGEVFYRALLQGPGALCVPTDYLYQDDGESDLDYWDRLSAARDEKLSAALRAYFVSGAVRLLQSKRSLAVARGLSSTTKAQVVADCPLPHTMLIHPAAQIESHFETARLLSSWSGIDVASSEPSVAFDAIGLANRLALEEPLWRSWLTEFSKSRDRLIPWNGSHVLPTTEDSDWPEIKRILFEEVFPLTDIRIINSDPRADDRPAFEPTPHPDGSFSSPRDIFTIFVSGNVMSRGLTLEGLTTTLFLRCSADPASDTQMQMQRWFGYRGPFLNLCRVFLYSHQLELFQSYHEADEALRAEIIGKMNEGESVAPSPTVLQGSDFRATAKITNLRALPLSPGADPFLKVAEDGAHALANVNILVDLLSCGDWKRLIVGEITRGLAMERTLSLLETAELLERFRYSGHDPDPMKETHKRWHALALQNGLRDDESPLFRPPGLSQDHPELVLPHACPYSVAAYLRLWAALLTRKARGICPTDDQSTPWSMIDLREYSKSAPRFYVGIRYGSAGLAATENLAARGVERMDRGYSHGVFRSSWGSRNPGLGPEAYLGDQLFDYHVHRSVPPSNVTGEPPWRKRGSPGLLLFHVVKGRDSQVDLITAGLTIPLGGPDHIAAIRAAI